MCVHIMYKHIHVYTLYTNIYKNIFTFKLYIKMNLLIRVFLNSKNNFLRALKNYFDT